MEYPELFGVCESVSAASQRTFRYSRAVELSLLVLAAATGEIPNTELSNLGPILAFIFFLLALALRLSGIGTRAEKRWYDARAACESIKSCSWQYAAALEPYDTGTAEAKVELTRVLRAILEVLPRLDVPSLKNQSAVATNAMNDIRELPSGERAWKYMSLRLGDQIDWYRDKATWNKDMARTWLRILIAVESSAVILGLLRMIGQFNVNWLGILAAAAAAIEAWQQTKNYSTLAESYAVTSHELSLVASSLEESINSDSWASAAKDAESAFSREHTLWLARRGNRT